MSHVQNLLHLLIAPRQAWPQIADDRHTARELYVRQVLPLAAIGPLRTDEHTSELQSLTRTSHAAFCLKTTNTQSHSLHKQTPPQHKPDTSIQITDKQAPANTQHKPH